MSPLWPGGIGPDGVEVQGRCTKGSAGTWEVLLSPLKKPRNKPMESRSRETLMSVVRGHRVIENPRPDPYAAARTGAKLWRLQRHRQTKETKCGGRDSRMTQRLRSTDEAGELEPPGACGGKGKPRGGA